MEISVARDGTETILSQEKLNNITECMNMIGSTAKGSVPYMRDMGLSRYLPRDDSRDSKNSWLNDLEEQLQRWDDRYEITDSRFETEEKVIVEVRLNGNY